MSTFSESDIREAFQVFSLECHATTAAALPQHAHLPDPSLLTCPLDFLLLLRRGLGRIMCVTAPLWFEDGYLPFMRVRQALNRQWGWDLCTLALRRYFCMGEGFREMRLEADPCMRRTIFQTFDRDGNGFIGASDLHNTYLAINEDLNDDEVALLSLILPPHVPGPTPESANHSITQVEGPICYRQCGNLTQDEPWSAQVDELIRLVDHDGDGQVSYEEFRKMVLEFNKKAAR